MENPWRVATNPFVEKNITRYTASVIPAKRTTPGTGNVGAEYIKPKRKLKPSPMS